MLDYFADYLGTGWNGLTDFIIPFLIVLSILVFVHEWGHYIVARKCGVKVDIFSIGFGKELFGWNDKNGTRWKVSLIPLGGYVQMYGDTDPSSAHSKHELTEEGEPRELTEQEKKAAFFAKPVWQRAAIVFAGPAINFIFAIVILTLLYASMGKPVSPPVAAAVMADSAAAEAGIEPHDRILSINGETINSFSDIQRRVAVSLNNPLDLVLLRDGEEISLTVTPKVETIEDRFGFEQSRGLMGVMGVNQGINVADVQMVNNRNISELDAEQKTNLINDIVGETALIGLPQGQNDVQTIRVRIDSPVEEESGTIRLTDNEAREIVDYSLGGSVIASLKETWFIVTGTLEALGQIITGARSATELGGIVRIGAVAGDAAQNGMIALISFTALLSINLGLINLFPIPLLDGGHLVFYAYEAVFGKPMSEKVMEYALKCGMVFLVALMAFANLNDILQLIF